MSWASIKYAEPSPECTLSSMTLMTYFPGLSIRTDHATKDGEVADKSLSYIDESVISDEEKYDGFYAVCTDLDESVSNIVKANKRRWEIEECFRIMKTDFEARPVYLNRQDRILAHFITCFIALIVSRYLEKKLGGKYIYKIYKSPETHSQSGSQDFFLQKAVKDGIITPQKTESQLLLKKSAFCVILTLFFTV